MRVKSAQPSSTRQQRRAAARDAAKAVVALTPGSGAQERVEPLLLQLLLKSNERALATQQAAVEAQGALKSIQQQIQETHKLQEGDGFDLKTGVIKRAVVVRKPKRLARASS